MKIINFKSKKNTGLKVKSKDKFHYRKGKAPYYTAPKFIQNNYGIKETFENGLFILNDGTYNKAYELIFRENADLKAAFKILRGYDLNFHIYNGEKIHLLIEGAGDKDYVKMMEDMERLETDMAENLKNAGITLEKLDLEKRFFTTHAFLTKALGSPEKALNVENYQTDVAAWMEDFLLKDADGVGEKQLLFKDKTYCMYFLKADENIPEIIKKLKLLKKITIRTDFESVKDQAVGAFFRNNYMGYEKELKVIKEEDPELFEVYTSDTNNEDKKNFTSCGVSILVQTENEKELENIEGNFKEISEKYSCEIEKNYGLQKELFIGFTPFSKCNYSSVRLYRSKHAANFFYHDTESPEADFTNFFIS